MPKPLDDELRARLWTIFAAGAVPAFEDEDDFTAEDVAEFAADVADELVDEYERRFGDQPRRTGRRRARHERED